MKVSIIIPILNKLEFTRQCLDRIWRNTDDQITYEVIVIDNGSSDRTAEWFSKADFPRPLLYHRNAENLGYAKGNNIGAQLSQAKYLLFLNNDTLVQPGWLSGMLRIADQDGSVGIVGIKQLFPYTNVIYHTGVVFAPGGIPQHLYPHLDASLPHVNKEREYQAVTGACLLVDRSLFEGCGGFDEGYVNGYEDMDLCLTVAQRGRKIVCCTSAFIYHYGQISDGRTADDDQNAARFARKWAGQVRADRDEYLARDAVHAGADERRASTFTRLPDDCIYLRDDLSEASALAWVNTELALSLSDRGVPVLVNADKISPTVHASVRQRLRRLTAPPHGAGGTQIKWSHYWPRYLNLELTGDVNLEIFVINYLFREPNAVPWDYWLQCLRQNHHDKLPISEFCRSVLLQLGLREQECHILHLGYSREIPEVEPPHRRDGNFRILTVTNSHDPERYNTRAVIEAYDAAFAPGDTVTLVIKDYGESSRDPTIHQQLSARRGGPQIEYITRFTSKPELIRLYKSCDAFVSAHRGEGFGMKILDAMACGLPVITPLFGGPTAYCQPDTCFPVSFALVPMGECLDSRSLSVTNAPIWAEVEPQSLRDQIRSVFSDRSSAKSVGSRGQTVALRDFSWDRAADRLIEIVRILRDRRERPPRTIPTPAPTNERSPYWLGLRISVVIPTRNRQEQLLACLDALARQSILPQEYEVVVVDDGSTDGLKEALEAQRFPFDLRYYSQEPSGPGAARNLGVEQARGELVLFIGDDIYAEEHMLEEHLLAHASDPDRGLAILGDIRWPETMTPNAVMDYVCGDAMLQFAYSYIPHAPVLDHRFFYTSNISLKRQFLIDAADAGICFDPCFRKAAFEDSEFAFRLIPRGLHIRYAAKAQAVHDHWMDLDSFSSRERGAGEMAVVFYRKHPGQDEQLQVRWIADLVGPALALHQQPGLQHHLESFDSQTDTLFRALAGSLEDLIATNRASRESTTMKLSGEHFRAALNNVLRVVFDIERTRGKIQEWYASVNDPAKVRAAQTLAAVIRKIEFLNVQGQLTFPVGIPSLDNEALAGLSGQIARIQGMPTATGLRAGGEPATSRRLRRILVRPSIASGLLKADRFIESRLQLTRRTAWLENYRRVRSRLRRMLI